MAATAGCVIVSDEKVLLLFHSRRQAYFFPGGKLEAGETPQDAALREVKEELGCDVHLGKQLDVFRYTAEGNSWESTLFLADITDQEPRVAEPEKFDHLLWMPLEECSRHPLSELVKLFCKNYAKKKYATALRRSP